MAKQKILVKREINDGGKVGRTTYYTATQENVIEALNVIEAHALQKIRSGVVVARISDYIHSMRS